MAVGANRRQDTRDLEGIPMPKEEWGVKRLCPTTGKRFYDLNKNPIVSPYTGEVVEVDSSKSRMIAADNEDAETLKAKAANLDSGDDVLDDDDNVDLELEDDVLDEDEDENVSLDDIADVPSDDEEN
jgi:uncharacterized protein (TIGR02300 family)